MFTIYPKAVKVFKAVLANSNTEVENHVETDIKPNSVEKQVAQSSQKTQKTAVTAATTKKGATNKVTKKPLKATIGLFYSYYKRPLNYLFSILAKPRKTAEQKETVKSLMAGLRKAEVKFQKEHKFSDSIVDLLINQRSLKLGKLEASFDAATASAVAELNAGGEIGVFYNMHKRPLSYLFALLKSPKLEKSDKKIVDSLVKGLRKAETGFMKDNDIKQSILDKLLKQRKLKLEASAATTVEAANATAKKPSLSHEANLVKKLNAATQSKFKKADYEGWLEGDSSAADQKRFDAAVKKLLGAKLYAAAHHAARIDAVLNQVLFPRRKINGGGVDIQALIAKHCN